MRLLQGSELGDQIDTGAGVWIPAFTGMTDCLAENRLNWNAIYGF